MIRPNSLLALSAMVLSAGSISARADVVLTDAFDGTGPLKGRKTSTGEGVWSSAGAFEVKAPGLLTSGGKEGGTACLPISPGGKPVTLSADVDTTKSGFIALTFMERGDLGFWNDAALWVAMYPNGKVELRAKNMEINLFTAEPAPAWKKGAPNKVEFTFDPEKKTTSLQINGTLLVDRKEIGADLKIAFAGLRFHPPLDGSSATLDNFAVSGDNATAISGIRIIPVLKPQANYLQPVEPIDTLIGGPLWSADTVTNEPVLFIDHGDGKPPSANLLFAPSEILSIRSADLSKPYTAGKDILAPASGSRELTLPSGSTVPLLKLEELFPPAGSPDAINAARGPRAEKLGGGRFLRWAENPRVFYLKQVLVTYRHTEKWDGFRPQFAGKELARTIGKLEKKQPVKIALIGDSISAGGSASATMRQPPLLPPFDRLVVDRLRKSYGGEINLVNLAKGGQITEWALTQVPLIIEQKPDLLMIAFGMNDGSGRIEPGRFAATHRKLIDEIRAGLPEVDIILVSPMHGNPEWTAGAPDLYPQYRDQLATFSGPGIALADVTTPYGEILARKSYADLTVNGVNHPNDFGHRIYAQVISGLLVK
jgi:acyl-CoA thioesterase-1